MAQATTIIPHLTDPTIEEMRRALSEADEWEREAAIYWFASDYHGGQWSNLYAALCASQYQPSMIERCPDGEDCYQALVEAFG
jgi:hypothetical protein